jgi:putative glutamine amidotransferase
MKQEITIGITDCSKYANYQKWIDGEPGVRVIKLSQHDNNLKDVDRCDGIILSGGEDIHPRYYNKPEYLDYCGEIDERRDEFELKVLQLTEQKQLPLLGICRGLQVANVYFGGTLIPDIPAFGRFNHSRFPDKDREHTVQVDPYSDLYKITGALTGQVNSAHHQSAELVAKSLITNSISADGIIEGLELKAKEGKPYLQLVQWHPERMNDQQNVFAKNIKRSFLEAVLKQQPA